MILFLVQQSDISNSYVVVYAPNREEAKRHAFNWFGAGEYDAPKAGNPDFYIVTPMTPPGARIHLDITVSV
jgi:hypothetical protein